MKKMFILIITLVLSVVLTSCKSDQRQRRPIPEDCIDADIYGDLWVPVWCDEFNGSEVDINKWTVLNTSWGGGNNEAQYYSPHNVYVEDGNLVIVALRESYGGKQYTSGRIHSQYKGDWLYGKVVVRAKIPGGRGTWPAIWMLPTENKYGTWPRSGEIDIMEYVGYDKDKIHGTIHTQKFNHNLGTQLGSALTIKDVEEQFIEYSMIWEPGKIQLYVNDQLLSTFAYAPGFNQDVAYNEAWPFDQKFHLIMNLAIGGNWGGSRGIDNNIFPVYMLVDYVRVYQKDYQFLDVESPSKINEIKHGNILKNMIYWNVPYDDLGIEHYEIYIGNELHAISRVNSYVFKNLTIGQSYNIKVIAVDFVGNKSDAVSYTLNFK